MGHARSRPKRLAEKLLQIRSALGLSQGDMAKRLRVEISAKHISRYERDQSEPPIEVLLAYARAAKVSLEHFVDDEMELPRGGLAQKLR